jgi:hypothetical protein
MEYEANKKSLKPAAKSMHKSKKKVVENLIKNGNTCEETAKICEIRKETVVAVRKEMESEGKLELGAWKREVSGMLAEFVHKGAERLVKEVNYMPIGQIPMSLAIAIDKVRDLQDAPTVRVEARLRITQDELNNAFNIDNKNIIDITNSSGDKTPENTQQNQH